MTHARQAEAEKLAETLSKMDLKDRLRHIDQLAGEAVFTTSLGIEDQVITSVIARGGHDIRIATLDTGRLFTETLSLIAETQAAYGIEIERYQPLASDVEDYVAKYGMNGFYDSVEARHACCGVRKLKPLERALSGAQYWITGLRRGQSANRAETPFAEYDSERDLIKVNPLADWDFERIEAHVLAHAVPVNPLHKRGYPSIGCEPCTRAIKRGEPERAGRWWWEQDNKRECGLHVPEAATVVASVPAE